MDVRRSIVMNVFWKLIEDMEYLRVTLYLNVDDVELIGVT